MTDMSHYVEKHASFADANKRTSVIPENKSKPFMLTLNTSQSFEAIHMYVVVTQMYVQGHSGDTNPAVSTVPPTGTQNTGLLKYQAEGLQKMSFR